MTGLIVFAVDHPHRDPGHVTRVYRKHLVAKQREFGSARGLIHYRQLLQTYLYCKALAIAIWRSNEAILRLRELGRANDDGMRH